MEPCVCSSACGSAVYDFDGKFDERRKLADIEKWNGVAVKDVGCD
jgi:hypothetical protein